MREPLTDVDLDGKPWLRKEIRYTVRSLEERFWEKVEKTDGCWWWRGATLPNGYGQFKLDSKQTRAHRVAWELTRGPIPEGLLCCHHCDNPSCVRPNHLYIGTFADNNADIRRRNRYPALTRCRNGHAYDEVGFFLWRRKNGFIRVCKVCTRAARRRWTQKRSERRAHLRAWRQIHSDVEVDHDDACEWADGEHDDLGGRA